MENEDIRAFRAREFLRDQKRLPPALFVEKYPGHTCVDNPGLPCPACTKWEGDQPFEEPRNELA